MARKRVMDLLVNLDVDDVERAIAFYRDGVGLRLGRRLFDGQVAEMLGAAAPIYLLAKRPGTKPHAGAYDRRRYGRHWTPVHLDFVVANVDAAVERAVAAGARLESGAETHAWGRIATLADPFGHGFCFVQWRGKGYDEV